jgi:Fe-S cluster assembly protein SufD
MTAHYIAQAERFAGERRSTDAGWLTGIRRTALDRFAALGIPTTQDEEWRFTSVAPIGDARFALAHNGARSVRRADVDLFQWSGPRSATLVFVNGRYVHELSEIGRLPAGVRVGALSSAMETRDAAGASFTRVADADRHAFTALNTAFLADGAVISVADGVVLPAPVHVVFLSAGDSPTMAHPRVLVEAGASSQVSIVESYGGAGLSSYWTNGVTEISAAQNATVHHYKIQRESPESFHLGAMYVHAAKDANVVCYSISFGGSLARNDVNVVLDGEGAGCTLNGLYLSDGSRLVDNHTAIDHAKPHCASREVYKGILADKSRAVFNGKIIVRPDAQKTDAKQTNKALLLSEDAQINTKPQLEIFANDVKCTHGAAIGQMDDDAIFYLRTRGLGEADARQMLIRAFAGDVIGRMPLEALRAQVDAAFVRRLPGWHV